MRARGLNAANQASAQMRRHCDLDSILPQCHIDQGLEMKRKSVAKGSSKHYRTLYDGELLAYILYRSIGALLKHKEHGLAPERLSAAAAGLCSTKRASAISGRFAVGPIVLEAILASWSAHICSYAKPGSQSIANETTFPHFGKKADDEQYLQRIPGKPHDYGLISYILAQRMQHTQLPIALALSINHLTRTLTPTDCVLELHSALIAADPNGPMQRQLVADSLWSSAPSLDAFDRHHIQYCVSLKTDSNAVPAALFNVADSELPEHASRTYTNGNRTFEVLNEPGLTRRTLTNMCVEDIPPSRDNRRLGLYETAVLLFDNESPKELVRMFRLGDEWATKTNAEIIQHRLGWDVLRSEDQQGTNAPLTLADAKTMNLSQLQAIRAQLLPRAKQSIGTKEEMLRELFPNEQHASDDNRAAGEEGRKRKRLAQEKLPHLALIREQVRIYFKYTFRFFFSFFFFCLPHSRIGAWAAQVRCTSVHILQ